jgi:hypothetical protein
MELTSLAILARLMDERHFHTRTAQLLENENIEFQIARDPRHVAGYDQVHRVVFPARQHKNSIELRPIAITAGVSPISEDLHDHDCTIRTQFPGVGLLLRDRTRLLRLSMRRGAAVNICASAMISL